MSMVFRDGLEWVSRESTGNAVYDAVSLYCDYMGIPAAGYMSIKKIYGDDFTCMDVARMSHITARKVKLNPKWYKEKSYPFLAFYGEDRHPVLCVPEGLKSYYAYDAVNNTRFKVTRKSASGFGEDGILFCRYLPKRSLKPMDIYDYAKHYVSKADLFNMCFTILVSTLIGLLLPILNEKLFDSLIPMGSYESILQVGIVILACSIGNVFFLLVKNFCSFRSLSLAKYALMDATFERIYHLPQSFIEEFGSIDLVNRALSMLQSVSSLSSSVITSIIGMVLSLVYLIRMFRKSWKLSLAALIMISICVLITVLINRRKERHIIEVEKESCTLRSKLYDDISGILKIRLSGMEDRSLYDYQKHNSKSLKHSLDSADIGTTSMVFSIFVSSIYTIVFYYLIVKKDTTFSIGNYTAFIAAFGLFSSAVMQFVDVLIMIPQVKPSFDRAMPIYETACETDGAGTVITKLHGNIEIDKLSFKYADDEEKIFKNVSLKIKEGEYVGIVGPSGCGKSTLVKLLLGYEKATTGKIYYDNKDIDTLDKTELRRQLGVVLQDGRLVTGTLHENIALAAPDISEDRSRELLIEAGFGPDLERMPMGVMTAVSELGGNISGGQQQRILIARALANDPAVMIFDEATSALDNKAQDVLCSTLGKRHCTRIAIAHRLTTVEKCDRIIVFDHGEIVEEGTYAELSAAGGIFERMVKEQQVFEQQTDSGKETET